MGCLQHCTLVLSDSHSHLPSFYRFAAFFQKVKNTFICHCNPSQVSKNITWWKEALGSDWYECSISIQSKPSLLSVFIDVSFGIGLLIDGQWLAWHLLEGWKSDSCDIGWTEMVTVDLGLHTLIHSDCHDYHIAFHSDNQDIVGALKAGRSYNSTQNEIFHQIIANFYNHKIWLSVSWIKSEDNILDSISWGILPLSIACHDHPPSIPSYLKPFVTLVLPCLCFLENTHYCLFLFLFVS